VTALDVSGGLTAASLGRLYWLLPTPSRRRGSTGAGEAFSEVDQEGAKGTTFAIARSVCLAIWETNRIAKDARGQITDPARKKYQPRVFVVFRRGGRDTWGAPMLELSLTLIFGFALGYGVRAMISRHRRRKSRNARR
jgi:hypothetical protein